MADVANEPGVVTALFLGNFDFRLDATTAVRTGNGTAENAAE